MSLENLMRLRRETILLIMDLILKAGDLAQSEDIDQMLLLIQLGLNLGIHLSKRNLRLQLQRIIEAEPGENQC